MAGTFGPSEWFFRHLERLKALRLRRIGGDGELLSRRALLREAAIVTLLKAEAQERAPAPLSQRLLQLAELTNSATATGRTSFVALDGSVAERYGISGHRGAANYCELTTGQALCERPGRLTRFLHAALQQLGYRRLSPLQQKQFERLEDVVWQFASPVGFPELAKYPLFLWACPSTISGGYLQRTEHNRTPTPPSRSQEKVSFTWDHRIPLRLGKTEAGPKLFFHPRHFLFEPQKPRGGPSRSFELSSFRRGVVERFDDGPYFATEEQSLLPADPGYSAEVIGPLSVRDQALGVTKGYTDLNVSLVRVLGEPTALTHWMHKVTLAFHPETLQLVQVALNAGEFNQYMVLTPGLESALTTCVHQGPHCG